MFTTWILVVCMQLSVESFRCLPPEAYSEKEYCMSIANTYDVTARRVNEYTIVKATRISVKG